MNLLKMMFLIPLVCSMQAKALPPSAMGGKEGGGGCVECAEFGMVLRDVFEALQKSPQIKRKFPMFSLEQLQSVLTARVLPQAPGQMLEADFDQKQWLIVVNQNTWAQIRQDRCRRERLAFRQALGLMGIADSKNTIANQVCQPFGSALLKMPPPISLTLKSSERLMGHVLQGNSLFTEIHLPKNIFSRDQAIVEYRRENRRSTWTLFVDSSTEWIIFIYKQNAIGDENGELEP